MKSDATEGWPDRYLGGGVWIEFKAAAFDRALSPYRLLRNEQHAICRALCEQGDHAHVIILLVDTQTNTRRVLWKSYLWFAQYKAVKWGRNKIIAHSHTYDEFLALFQNFVNTELNKAKDDAR